jgi:hypothetical protein
MQLADERWSSLQSVSLLFLNVRLQDVTPQLALTPQLASEASFQTAARRENSGSKRSGVDDWRVGE